MQTTSTSTHQTPAGNWVKLPADLALKLLPRRGRYTDADALNSLVLWVHKERRLPSVARAASRWGWGWHRAERLLADLGPRILACCTGEANGEANGEASSHTVKGKQHTDRRGERRGFRRLFTDVITDGVTEGGGDVLPSSTLPRAVTATAPSHPTPPEAVSTTPTQTPPDPAPIPNDSRVTVLVDHLDNMTRAWTGMGVPTQYRASVEGVYERLLTGGASTEELDRATEAFITRRKERGKVPFWSGYGADLQEQLVRDRAGATRADRDAEGERYARVGRNGDHWTEQAEAQREQAQTYPEGQRLRAVPAQREQAPSIYPEYRPSRALTNPDEYTTPEEFSAFLGSRRRG